MTEGAPEPFATKQDVIDRWRPLTDEEGPLVETRLGDVAAIIRTAIPDIDARIAADSTGSLARAALVASYEAVRRVTENPQGARRLQETIGLRAYSLDFGERKASGLFLTADELMPLQPTGLGGQGEAIGTAIASTRAGWAPVTHAWWSGF